MPRREACAVQQIKVVLPLVASTYLSMSYLLDQRVGLTRHEPEDVCVRAARGWWTEGVIVATRIPRGLGVIRDWVAVGKPAIERNAMHPDALDAGPTGQTSALYTSAGLPAQASSSSATTS